MISYKCLLEIKRIVELEELKSGEIAFFNNNLVLKDFNGNINYVDIFLGETSFTIYGIRVPVKSSPNDMTDNTIERVLIKRTINNKGEVLDYEYIGDETGLEFNFIEDNEFYGHFESDKLNEMHPFNKMDIQEYQISPTKQYISPSQTSDAIDTQFTKLPLFFKNKQKTKTINGVTFDYYLISDVWFSDFYPVESHLKDDGTYANCIWLETNWRITNLSEGQIGDSSAFFDGDFVKEAEESNKPTYIINSSVWFDYLYYIYMIKTASFNPILSSIEETNFSINNAITYVYYEKENTSYKSVFNNIDTNKEFTSLIGNITISNFSSDQIVLDINEADDVVEHIKNNFPDTGLFCLVVTNDISGLSASPMSLSYINNNCAEFYGAITKNVYGYPNRLIFNSYGFLTEPVTYQNLTSSPNLYLLLIKSIPPLVCGVSNNHITNFGEISLDNIKNIFPIYFSNGMFRSTSDEYLSNSDYIFSLPYNYSIYIDSGCHSSWFNNSTTKPQNLLSKLRGRLLYYYFNGLFADYKESTNNIISTTVGNKINCIISLENKKIKQKDIYPNGVEYSSDITNFSEREGCVRGNLNGCIYENSGDSYPWQEYELFTGCLLKDNTITLGWSNFTLNQRDTKFSGYTEYRLNNDCVTRLMFFDD